MPVTTPRRATPAEARAAAVKQLERAEPGRARVDALLGVIDDVAASDPEVARFRFSLAASMRAALASGSMAEQLAGDPRIVIEGIELPGFSEDDIAQESAMRGQARARIFDEELLSAAAVSALLGSVSKNPRQYANKRRLRSEIVAVPHQNQYLYPAFQFDAQSHAIWPEVSETNRVLGAVHDPWGVASWWLSSSGALGGRLPKDLVGTPGSLVILVELATDLVRGE